MMQAFVVGAISTAAMFAVVIVAEWGESLVGWGPVVLIDALVAAGLFAFAVPRVLDSPNSTSGLKWALTFSALGVVSLAAFWMGLSIVFGAAGILLGSRGPQRSGLAKVSMLLGGLAVVAGLIMPLIA